jgi:hypothetical protein
VETLAASPVEAPQDAITTDPGHGIQTGDTELSVAPAESHVTPSKENATGAAGNGHAQETASTLVSEAEADAALSEENVPNQSTSPEGFARADQVAADAGGSEEASREPATPGAGGSALLESEAENTRESEEEARNA